MSALPIQVCLLSIMGYICFLWFTLVLSLQLILSVADCACVVCLQREEYCRSVQDGQFRSHTPARQPLDTGVSIRQLVSTFSSKVTACVLMDFRMSALSCIWARLFSCSKLFSDRLFRLINLLQLVICAWRSHFKSIVPEFHSFSNSGPSVLKCVPGKAVVCL